MATQISSIESLARLRLIESTASFWSSAELVDIIIAGIKDLWRDIVDLKQEHYLTVNTTDVYLAVDATELSGVPSDVHKIYMIEGRDLTTNSANVGLQFMPLDYNHRNFQLARSRGSINPQNDTIYYCPMGAGAPVGAPVIKIAPTVSSLLNISFSYVPTLPILTSTSLVPIPGEADNALVAWTVAYARGKEREDRSPDSNWLAVYATEKQHLLQSLGVRQYQEPQLTDAMFQEYWGLFLAVGLAALPFLI